LVKLTPVTYCIAYVNQILSEETG